MHAPFLSHYCPCCTKTNRNKTWRDCYTHLMSLVLFGIGDSSSTRIDFLPPHRCLPPLWGTVTHWAAFGLRCDVESRAAGVLLWLKQDPLSVRAHQVWLGQHVHWNTSGQSVICPTEGLISPPEIFYFTLFMVWSSQARWLWDTDIYVCCNWLRVLLFHLLYNQSKWLYLRTGLFSVNICEIHTAFIPNENSQV